MHSWNIDTAADAVNAEPPDSPAWASAVTYLATVIALGDSDMARATASRLLAITESMRCDLAAMAAPSPAPSPAPSVPALAGPADVADALAAYRLAVKAMRDGRSLNARGYSGLESARDDAADELAKTMAGAYDLYGFEVRSCPG